MKIFEFIENDMKNKNSDELVIYNKQIYIFYYSFDFIKNDDGQIQRITKFYLVPYDEAVYLKEAKIYFKMTTRLYKNYFVLIDSINNSVYKGKEKFLKPFATRITDIKNNKQSIIDYQKQNEFEYIERDLMKLMERIKDYQNNLVSQGEKYRDTKLKKYTNLLIALNSIKAKESALFIQKLINSTDEIQKDLKDEFLKWCLKNEADSIKRAIVYILNVDYEKGLNTSVFYFDIEEQKYKRKWETKLYYRDLYLKLFNQYLNQTNGDKKRAKELTMKDINENHIRPKATRWLHRDI